MLAVAAGFEGAFWLIGGVDLIAGADGNAQRRYLTDAYRYDPRSGWKRIADLPYSVVAGPSPAPIDKKCIYLLAATTALKLQPRPTSIQVSGTTALRYKVSANKWGEAGSIAAPRASPSVGVLEQRLGATWR